MAEISLVRGKFIVETFSIHADDFPLGRHNDCLIMSVFAEDSMASRHHAVIRRVDGLYYLEDVGSRNGTFLNGNPVKRRSRLVHNDRLLIGGTEFLFVDPNPNVWDRIRNSPVSQTPPSVAVDKDEKPNILSAIDVSGSSLESPESTDRRAELKLLALLKLLSKLGRTLDRTQTLSDLMDGLFSIFRKADRCFVGLVDEPTGDVHPEAHRYRRSEDEEEVHISRTIVEQVIHQRQAILSNNAAQDLRFKKSESLAAGGIRSMLCSPLIDIEDNVIGLIQLDTLGHGGLFDDQDLEILVSVSPQLAMALRFSQINEDALRRNTIMKDLELASRVQRGLLPDSRPCDDEYEFFDYYEPAFDVGGDYYDYIPLPQNRTAIVLADASGKGVSAALLMTKVSSELRFSLSIEPDVAKAVERTNRSLCDARLMGRFVTLLVVVIDHNSHEITLVNAGHIAPLIRRRDGTVENAGDEQRDMAIGILEDRAYQTCVLQLGPGDCVIMFTDGFSEAENEAGDYFGLRTLTSRLESTSGSAAKLGETIVNEVDDFVGQKPQADDMCLLCFGRRANPLEETI